MVSNAPAKPLLGNFLMATTAPSSGTIILVVVIVLSFFRRIRNIGRRPLRTGLMVTYVAIYSFLCFVLGLASLIRLELLGGYTGGLLAGLILGVVGVRLTSFETTPAGRFYTPDKYLGSAILLFWIARIGYRLSTMPDLASGAPPPADALSPLTLLVSGLLIGYYLVYYVGLLIRSRKML